MDDKVNLRHAGILVEDLAEAVLTYQELGFERAGKPEGLLVQKMIDGKGNVIELVKGNWHPHIAVNWYDDGQGNYVEVVKDER